MNTPGASVQDIFVTVYGNGERSINRRGASVGFLAGISLFLTGAAALPEKGEPPLTAQTRSSGGPLDPAQEKVRFDSADLKFEILPDTESIKGVATLHFTAKAGINSLVVDLDRNLPISAISIDGQPLKPTAWSNPEGRVTIKLPRMVAAGRPVTAAIRYAGTPHVAVRAPWDGGFVWAKTPAGAPWVATAVQMEGCDLFWPCIDYPTYEPDQIDLHITVPKGLVAPSNGVFVGKQVLPDGRTTWNWRVKDPTLYGVALNVGPYEVISGEYKSRFGNTIPMYYWYLPGEEQKAKALFAEFAPTLDFFETMIGPYPFGDQKLGVVETPHKGMEHQTINAYGNNYAKTPWGYDDLFQHEFSHEWFANQLTAANWDDFWLHEGFASYMQPLYGQWRDGDGVYTAMLLQSRLGIRNKAPIVSGKPQDAEYVYVGDKGPGGDIYSKGSWVLHTLRNYIGDKDFFNAIRLVTYGRDDPRPGNFKPMFRTTPDFIAAVNKETGRNLQWFFDVYIYSAALPELVQSRHGDTLTLTWQVPGGKPFPLPVEVQVDGVVRKVEMQGNSATIAVPASAHVVIDPMDRVLRVSPTVDAFQAWRAAQSKQH